MLYGSLTVSSGDISASTIRTKQKIVINSGTVSAATIEATTTAVTGHAGITVSGGSVTADTIECSATGIGGGSTAHVNITGGIVGGIVNAGSITVNGANESAGSGYDQVFTGLTANGDAVLFMDTAPTVVVGGRWIGCGWHSEGSRVHQGRSIRGQHRHRLRRCHPPWRCDHPRGLHPHHPRWRQPDHPGRVHPHQQRHDQIVRHRHAQR